MNYQTLKRIMMCIFALTTVLTIIIIILLPMNTVRDFIVMLLVIAVAFIANTLNFTLSLIALATKEGISDSK